MPLAVPFCVISAVVKVVGLIASLKVTVKRTGRVLAGSAWPAAWLTVTLAARILVQYGYRLLLHPALCSVYDRADMIITVSLPSMATSPTDVTVMVFDRLPAEITMLVDDPV